MRRRPDPAAAAPPAHPHWTFADAARPPGGGGSTFAPSRAEERRYARQLKSVAGRVRQIAAGAGEPEQKIAHLRRYMQTLGPWAEQAASAMLAGVERQNAQVWARHATRIGAGLRDRLDVAVNGATLRQLIDANAALILSLPADAARRIGHYTAQALTTGQRPETLARKIQALGDITEARARTIARTEISKASTALTRTRAQAVGSVGYIWRTARDGGVRDSHAAMEGQYVPWDQPPTLDDMTGHAGEFPNCRCYAEPVIPQPPHSGRRSGTDIPSPLPVAEDVDADPHKGLLSRWEQDNKEIVPHEEGQPLPGAAAARVPMRKLTDYVLDPDHPSGKGRVLRAALGLEARHAEDLREQILARIGDVSAGRVIAGRGVAGTDQYGERFRAVMTITGPNGQTMDVVTAWIYDREGKSQSDVPRLVSMFPAD